MKKFFVNVLIGASLLYIVLGIVAISDRRLNEGITFIVSGIVFLIISSFLFDVISLPDKEKENNAKYNQLYERVSTLNTRIKSLESELEELEKEKQKNEEN